MSRNRWRRSPIKQWFDRRVLDRPARWLAYSGLIPERTSDRLLGWWYTRCGPGRSPTKAEWRRIAELGAHLTAQPRSRYEEKP